MRYENARWEKAQTELTFCKLASNVCMYAFENSRFYSTAFASQTLMKCENNVDFSADDYSRLDQFDEFADPWQRIPGSW